MKSVQENEASRFCYALTLQGQGHRKQYKIAEVTGAYKHGRYKRIWLNSLRVMSSVKVFAMQDGQLDEHNSLHRSIWYS